jgi:hypothetical protein
MAIADYKAVSWLSSTVAEYPENPEKPHGFSLSTPKKVENRRFLSPKATR